MCGVHCSGLAAIVGGGPAGGCTSWKKGIDCTSGEEAAVAQFGEGSKAPCLAGLAAERHNSEAAKRRAWQV